MIEFERVSAAPEGSTEIARTPRSKAFRLPDKRIRLIHTQRRIHYRDNGLQDIDLTPRTAGSAFVVDKAPYIATLAGTTLDYVSRAVGHMTLELQSIGVGALNINPQIAADRITFPEISPGVDVHLVFGTNGVRWLKVLKNPTAATDFTWRFRPDPAFAGAANIRTQGMDAERRRVQIERDEITSGLDRIITETFTGQVSTVIDSQTRRKQWMDNPTYPVRAGLQNFPIVLDPDFTETIQAGDDMVTSYEYTGGTYGFFETPDNVYCGEAPNYWNSNGAIFQGLAIANAATVSLAEYKINVNQITGTPTTENKVYMWDIDNPTDWTTTNRPKNIEQAGSLTTASTDVAFTTTGAKAIDVTAILQEIVDRGGWGTGNNVALICVNTKVSPAVENEWRADGFNAAGEATLEVTLAAAGGRIMSSLANTGGLAGMGGIAGRGGGLAGCPITL